MADRKPNPIIMALRKELELSEKRTFLQRQQLRRVELDEEIIAINDAMKTTNEQILVLEAEVAELRKIQ
jgi:hypothetical protein